MGSKSDDVLVDFDSETRVFSGGYYDALAEAESTHDDPPQEDDTST
jgi:hypothetical protein